METAAYVVTQPIPAEHEDAEALVVWGTRCRCCRMRPPALGALRWVHDARGGRRPAPCELGSRPRWS